MQLTRLPRLYVDDLPGDVETTLPADRAHYLRNVLRAKIGQSIIVFDGRGVERIAEITLLTKSAARLRFTAVVEPQTSSPLELELVQAIPKSDAMDLIVQKATELGVTRIRPVVTEFGVVRPSAERAARRLEHWRRIAQSACEQSGRHFVPEIDAPRDLADALAESAETALRLVLDPGGEHALAQILGTARPARCILLIGPEGGFSQRDLACAARAGFASVTLGPRILRVETAALTACALAQSRWGDLR